MKLWKYFYFFYFIYSSIHSGVLHETVATMVFKNLFFFFKLYFTHTRLLNTASFSSFIQLFILIWTHGYFILWVIIYYYYYSVQIVEIYLVDPFQVGSCALFL